MLGHTRWASRRHHLRAQRPSAELRRGRRAPTARYVDRRAQRRRRQLRRPQGRRRPAHRARDHHRRQGHPDARLPRRSRDGARRVEAFRAHGRAARGLGRHRRQRRRRPRAAAASRCGAAARRSTSGSPRTPSSWRQRALRRGRGDATVPPPRRRDAGGPRQPDREPRPDRRARRPRAAGSLAGIRRWSYDGTELPVADDELHHGARSPPATSTAASFPHFLLKEITERPRRSARRCGASSSSATGALAVRLGDETLPADRARRPRATARIAPGARDRPGHGGGRRPEPRRRARRAARRHGRCAVEAVLATELSGLRAARRHERHARRRDQPVGHHHRHQPHRRPGPRPRRARSSRSSTAATATSPTSPTACSTRPTAATSR